MNQLSVTYLVTALYGSYQSFTPHNNLHIRSFTTPVGLEYISCGTIALPSAFSRSTRFLNPVSLFPPSIIIAVEDCCGIPCATICFTDGNTYIDDLRPI